MTREEILDAVIKIATENPQARRALMPLIKKASVFPADSIGAPSKMHGEDGSDAEKGWAKGQFTQQESSELRQKYMRGDI